MNTNNKLNKANSYRLSQELLRNKALKNGVNLVAPETIFLSKDTFFGKNVIFRNSISGVARCAPPRHLDVIIRSFIKILLM